MESRIGTGDNPLCGDTIRVFIDIERERIVDAQWEGYGCDLCLKSADDLMESLIGLSLDEAGLLIDGETARVHEDEGIRRTRKKCVLLPFDAVKSIVTRT